MEKENIVPICKECADERKQNMQKKLDDMLAQLKEKVDSGKDVWFKVGLKCDDETEHVWIKVTGMNMEYKTFIGTVDNDIVTVWEKYSYNDTVTIPFSEIEDVYQV